MEYTKDSYSLTLRSSAENILKNLIIMLFGKMHELDNKPIVLASLSID